MPGRWKLGPGGAYYDSQDTGPDQVTPPPQPTAPQPAPAEGQMPFPGSDMGGGYKPWSEQFDDGQGGYWNPGGHFDKDGNQLPVTPFEKPTPFGPKKPTPMGPMVLSPGENGAWGMDGGQAQDFQSILAALRARFGGSSGAMGALTKAIPEAPTMNAPTGAAGSMLSKAAPSSTGSGMMSLGGLMSGLRKPW